MKHTLVSSKKREHLLDAVVSVCYKKPPGFSGGNDSDREGKPTGAVLVQWQAPLNPLLGKDMQFQSSHCGKNATKVEEVQQRADGMTQSFQNEAHMLTSLSCCKSMVVKT